MAARPRPCAGRPLKISAAAGVVDALPTARTGEKHSRGLKGGSHEPPGPLLTHLRTVHMVFPECLPTRLSPLAERARFSQAHTCFNQLVLPRYSSRTKLDHLLYLAVTEGYQGFAFA